MQAVDISKTLVPELSSEPGQACASRVQLEGSDDSTIRCSKCVLDQTVPEITFNQAGVCNYCRLHAALDSDFPNDERGSAVLHSIVENIKAKRGTRKYDCVIGVSGGTDSTYLTHLVKELGLNPLAVHLDCGWDSEIAVSNIKNSLQILGVDLFTYVVNWEEIKDLYRSALKASIPWPDGVTDAAIVASLYRVAAEHNIKHIFVGNNFRTEGRQPDDWTDFDGKVLSSIHRKFGTKKLKTFPNYTAWSMLYYGYLRGIKMVRPFYYIKYVKDDAKKLLTEKYGWRDYGGHHHESVFTRYIIGVWLPKKFGIDKRKITFSALVRSGELDRSSAIATLQQPAYDPAKMKADEDYVIKKLGFTREQFQEIWNGPNCRHTDYPNYTTIYRKVSGLAEVLMKFILPWKPMMFYRPSKF